MSEDAQNQTQESVVDESDSQEASKPIQAIDSEDTISETPDAINADDQASNTTDSEIPVDNESRLLQLEKEHTSLREEHETLRGQYMRIAADFDNFRKRQSRDQDDLRLQLTCSTLSEILPIVDNFERARQQLNPQGEEALALHRSYQGLYKQLVEVLKQLGVAPMRVVGQVFDPNLHEAVLREPSEEQPEDVVIEELQRGYHLNGRVLRHAMVKVSMGPGSNVVDTSNHSDENASENSDDVSGAPE